MCSILIDFCKSSPCSKLQICVNSQYGYTCECSPGFPCFESRPSLIPHQSRAQKKTNSEFTDPCIYNSCKNDALCFSISSQIYKCQCGNDWTGKIVQFGF